MEPWYALINPPPKGRIILMMTDEAGDRFAMVVDGDGCLGVTRNDEPVPGCRWDGDGMEQCVTELLRLARESGGA